MNVLLRPATGDDLASLVSLEAQTFSAPWSETALASHIAAGHALTLLLLEDETPVGYLLAGFSPPEGELYRIGVLPDRRRRGYGRRLLDWFFRTAEEREVYTLYLEVRESNGAAISLYRSAGFREIFLRENYYRDPTEAALVMTIGRPKESV